MKMKPWFYAARKTQTLRSVSSRQSRGQAQGLTQTSQAHDEQCTHLALLIQTFLLLPTPELCFLFFILLAEWQKENGF